METAEMLERCFLNGSALEQVRFQGVTATMTIGGRRPTLPPGQTWYVNDIELRRRTVDRLELGERVRDWSDWIRF